MSRLAVLSLHADPCAPLGAPDRGGMSVVVRRLARGLAARGWRVDLYTADAPGPAERELEPGVRWVAVPPADGPVPKHRLLPRLDEVADRIDRFRRSRRTGYDAVYSHYWLSAAAGADLARQWGAAHMVTFHTLAAAREAAGGRPDPGPRPALERRLARTCDRVIAPTPAEAARTVALCGARPERVTVVPWGVDRDRFRPGDRARARSALGLPDDRPTTLFVGRLVPDKGFDRLVDAVARIPEPDRPRVVAVGGAPDDPAARSAADRARRRGVAEAVRFVGPAARGDLPDWYRAADVVAVPSRYESFGLVVLEALACGTPVAAFPVGVAQQAVRPGQTGELARDPSPGAFARALVRVLGGRYPADRVRAATAGYGWDRAADAVAAALAETIGARIERGDPSWNPCTPW